MGVFMIIHASLCSLLYIVIIIILKHGMSLYFRKLMQTLVRNSELGCARAGHGDGHDRHVILDGSPELEQHPWPCEHVLRLQQQQHIRVLNDFLA